jgi:hypothetical protein
MDNDDIIIDDGDPRNARVRVVRHPAAIRPGTYPQRAPSYRPAHAYPQSPMYHPGYATPVYQPAPVIVQPQRRFLDMPTGEVLALAAQAFAALQPLPAAPTALGKADDDVSNLITYQSALATHAKRDEQLRTIGALVAKFLA